MIMAYKKGWDRKHYLPFTKVGWMFSYFSELALNSWALDNDFCWLQVIISVFPPEISFSSCKWLHHPTIQLCQIYPSTQSFNFSSSARFTSATSKIALKSSHFLTPSTVTDISSFPYFPYFIYPLSHVLAAVVQLWHTDLGQPHCGIWLWPVVELSPLLEAQGLGHWPPGKFLFIVVICLVS